jgi:hypothetical protein
VDVLSVLLTLSFGGCVVCSFEYIIYNILDNCENSKKVNTYCLFISSIHFCVAMISVLASSAVDIGFNQSHGVVIFI